MLFTDEEQNYGEYKNDENSYETKPKGSCEG
jgi:hypothetical protein